VKQRFTGGGMDGGGAVHCVKACIWATAA
jgi:hypothetical protein